MQRGDGLSQAPAEPARWLAPRDRGGRTAGARSGGTSEDGRVRSTRSFKHPASWLDIATAPASQQLAPAHCKKLQQDKTRELLRMPTNRSCPDGYHSQLGVDISGDRKSKTEVVVNKNFQVYPAYRVTYRPGGALPDPLSRAGNDALKTFDEYKASDFDREAQDVLL